MVKIETKCDYCYRNYLKIEIGQIAGSSELKWYESHYCSYCGLAMEVDGRGFPPDSIRNIILEQQGTYYFKIDSLATNCKINSIKIVRQAFNLSMTETKNIFKIFPNLVRGTKVEMEWLQQKLLVEAGIKSTVCLSKNPEIL